MQTRSAARQALEVKAFDVCVVGGGASGLGVALDAVTRGYSVALVEAGDYGGGTSATSTKLIHGGVRYLEKAFMNLDYGQYKLVKEALRERRRMLDAAPTLSEPLEIIIPVFNWWQKLYFGIGMKVYDWLAGKGKLTPSSVLSKQTTLERFPLLNSKRIAGGIAFYDGQFNDVGFALALAETADSHGAVLCNHLATTAITQEKEQIELICTDSLDNTTVRIKARSVVNCTGPMADRIRLMLRPDAQPRLRPSKGIHILTEKPAEIGRAGMFIPETDDGRVIFVLPWQQSLLIGTTDTEVSDPNAPSRVTREDIDYLIKHVNRYLTRPIIHAQIKGVIAGNRPLVSQTGGSTEALIRNHEVECWPEQRAINLLGGKWTTYRQMAEDTVDALEKLLNQPVTSCQTSNMKLDVPASIDTLTAEGLTTETIRELALKTQAVCIGDVLDQRLRVRIQDTQKARRLAPKVALALGEVFDWTNSAIKRELENYKQQLDAEIATYAEKDKVTVKP